MPGCLGLDALWQLTGFFLGWLGAPGRGRALGVGEVKFTGMVLPTVKRIEYIVDLKRVILRKLKLAIADGSLLADGQLIYSAQDLRVGLFEADPDPSATPAWQNLNSVGAGWSQASDLLTERPERVDYETGRRDRNGDCFQHREQHPGSAHLTEGG